MSSSTCVTIQRGGTGSVADAFIKSSALNQSFGTQPVLRVSANDESLLRFDLSSLPSNAAIDSATLELYVNGDYGDGSIDVHRVLAPWTEANVTFGSFQQRFDSGNAAVFRVESRTALKNVDVTALARSWLNGAQPNYGMLLAEGADHHALRNNPQDEDKTPTLFVSSDASNASKRPALSVCYTVTTDDCSPNPCENGGTCSNTSTGHTCACAPGFTGNNCETKIDECAASPCLNGGTCVDAGGSYTCTCATGFTGASCETNIDDCAPNPCQNGGVCTDGIASYTCTCAPGFDGPNCANQIDNCASTPCHNGGTCSSVGAGYTCSCAAGFTGPTCDTNIDDCVNNACVNGTCVDGINSYTCSCAPDWGGTYCDVNLNTCAQHPCLNGGTCTNLPGNYTCSCAAGYTGTNCEIDINDCAPNPCENGGTCVDGVNSYACTCAAGYTGTQCETAVPPPVIAPISPVTMRAGATANALVTATDPSSSPITFSLGAGAPTWALLVPISTGTVEIALAPDSNVSGNFSIEIDATDGLGATAKAFLAVSVRADHPPVITVSDALGPVGTNINMRAGTAEQLAIAATSPDGWPVAVTVTTDPGGTTIDRLTNVWTWDTTSFDVGQTRTIHVEANDGVITVDEDVRVTVVPGLVQATTSAGDDPTPADPVYLEANGRAYVLVPEPAGLVVFDVTNDQIARVAVATTYGPAVGVAVISHWAFVAQGNAGVAIFDITNPNAPLHFGEIADPSDPVVGVTANPAMSQLVLSMGDGTLRFVDLSTFLLVPTHDLSWTSLSLPDALGFGVALGRPAIWGTHLFVPDGTNNVVDDVSLTTAGGPSVTGQMSFASCDFAASIQPFTTAANPHTFAIANCTDTAYVVDLTDFAAGISYTAAFLGSTSGESSAVVGTTMWTRTANFLTRSDVSNPFFPVQSDEVLVLADPTRGLAGNPAATRLYVSERGGGLAIIANDSASIVAEAPHVVPAGPTAIDGTLGVAVDGEQLFVFDTSAFPPVQVGVGTRAPGGFAQGMIAVALRGTLAITSEDIWGGSVGINRWIGVRLRTWDVSNPSAPHEISSVDVTNTSNLAIGTKAVHFIPQSNLVGVAGNMLGLVLFDVSNPAAPIVSKTVNMSINGAPLFDATVTDFASEGRYVFTVAANYPDTERVHVSAFDLGTPALAANATQVGLLRLPIGNEGWASLDAATHTLYVTEGPNGLAAVNVSNPAAMVQRSQLTFPFALLGASAFVGFPAAPLVMPGRVLESTAGYLVDVPRAADGSLGAAEYIPTAISGTLSTDTSCSLVTGTTCAAVTGGGGTQLWIP